MGQLSSASNRWPRGAECLLLAVVVVAVGSGRRVNASAPGPPSPLTSAWQLQQQHQQQQQILSRPLPQRLQLGPTTNEPTSGPSQDPEEFGNPNYNNAGHEITKILQSFFEGDKYDKRVRPNYSGPPALVNVSFHIIGISSVSEVQMDFTTDFYFRQKWFDPRLQFRSVALANNTKIDDLVVGSELAELIWLPDTFFANEKTATFHKATTENTFIRVGSNGRVYRSIRLTVTCSCPMDLQYFPMDRQRCKIEIESYGYNTRDIDYRWEKDNESVTLDDKIELPQFKVLGFKMGQELQSLSSGDYIRLYCEVHFVRSMGYYLIQIYIPASLIVIISWVSFWLHRNATPARVALGVTTVLTMTTLMSSTNAALPKISYIKSIDVFLGTCFVMVFASLLEYASVGYIGKRIAMKRKRQQDLKQMQQHHQRVCVAAAASAAAAAAAAQQANPVGVVSSLGSNQKQQLLVLDSKDPHGAPKHSSRPVLVRHLTAAANEFLNTGSGHHHQQQQPHHHEDQHYAAAMARHHPTGANIKIAPEMGLRHAPMLMKSPQAQAPQAAPSEPADSSAVVVSKAATEGEATVRICGLTPSAIDKYSRVVFPICFVCFNLMYWIIYGHISQQIDDHGPPLIPFVRS